MSSQRKGAKSEGEGGAPSRFDVEGKRMNNPAPERTVASGLRAVAMPFALRYGCRSTRASIFTDPRDA
jgi:hypothetical protein